MRQTELSLNAQALESRLANKALNAIFNRLPENLKWEWTLYSTNHTVKECLNYIKELDLRNEKD